MESSPSWPLIDIDRYHFLSMAGNLAGTEPENARALENAKWHVENLNKALKTYHEAASPTLAEIVDVFEAATKAQRNMTYIANNPAVWDNEVLFEELLNEIGRIKDEAGEQKRGAY